MVAGTDGDGRKLFHTLPRRAACATARKEKKLIMVCACCGADSPLKKLQPT
jgi:hypothetical protein